MTLKYPAIDLSKIRKFDFPEDQYYKEETIKRQICLHHTASGPGAGADINWWRQDPRRVATTVIIDRSGEIDQCFISQYWAHHLGTTVKKNTELNKMCIGIEIDAWGPLIFHNGAYRSYLGAEVPADQVTEYKAGFKILPSDKKNPTYFDTAGMGGKKATFYHSYTPAQILAVAQLLELWCLAYKIPTNYNEDMWDVNTKALRGEPGIWTHVSYRADKLDCHPQPELVAMLKSLSE